MSNLIDLQANCAYNLNMNYDFDPQKLSINVTKHGVWFQLAEAFDWENAVISVDVRKEYGETRFIAVAPIGHRIYVMTFCLRDAVIKIINLRKANQREVTRYVNQT